MSEEIGAGAGFCHIEIPAPDLEKAKKFYEEVFNWEINSEMGMEGYWFFKTENIGGAFSSSLKPSTEGVAVILNVDDVTGKTSDIKKAGGKIVQGRTEIGGGMGFYAYFTDINGNKLGIWSQN